MRTSSRSHPHIALLAFAGGPPQRPVGGTKRVPAILVNGCVPVGPSVSIRFPVPLPPTVQGGGCDGQQQEQRSAVMRFFLDMEGLGLLSAASATHPVGVDVWSRWLKVTWLPGQQCTAASNDLAGVAKALGIKLEDLIHQAQVDGHEISLADWVASKETASLFAAYTRVGDGGGGRTFCIGSGNRDSSQAGGGTTASGISSSDGGSRRGTGGGTMSPSSSSTAPSPSSSQRSHSGGGLQQVLQSGMDAAGLLSNNKSSDSTLGTAATEESLDGGRSIQMARTPGDAPAALAVGWEAPAGEDGPPSHISATPMSADHTRRFGGPSFMAGSPSAGRAEVTSGAAASAGKAAGSASKTSKTSRNGSAAALTGGGPRGPAIQAHTPSPSRDPSGVEASARGKPGTDPGIPSWVQRSQPPAHTPPIYRGQDQSPIADPPHCPPGGSHLRSGTNPFQDGSPAVYMYSQQQGTPPLSHPSSQQQPEDNLPFVIQFAQHPNGGLPWIMSPAPGIPDSDSQGHHQAGSCKSGSAGKGVADETDVNEDTPPPQEQGNSLNCRQGDSPGSRSQQTSPSSSQPPYPGAQLATDTMEAWLGNYLSFGLQLVKRLHDVVYLLNFASGKLGCKLAPCTLGDWALDSQAGRLHRLAILAHLPVLPSAPPPEPSDPSAGNVADMGRRQGEPVLYRHGTLRLMDGAGLCQVTTEPYAVRDEALHSAYVLAVKLSDSGDARQLVLLRPDEALKMCGFPEHDQKRWQELVMVGTVPGLMQPYTRWCDQPSSTAPDWAMPSKESISEEARGIKQQLKREKQVDEDAVQANHRKRQQQAEQEAAEKAKAAGGAKPRRASAQDAMWLIKQQTLKRKKQTPRRQQEDQRGTRRRSSVACAVPLGPGRRSSKRWSSPGTPPVSPSAAGDLGGAAAAGVAAVAAESGLADSPACGDSTVFNDFLDTQHQLVSRLASRKGISGQTILHAFETWEPFVQRLSGSSATQDQLQQQRPKAIEYLQEGAAMSTAEVEVAECLVRMLTPKEPVLLCLPSKSGADPDEYALLLCPDGASFGGGNPDGLFVLELSSVTSKEGEASSRSYQVPILATQPEPGSSSGVVTCRLRRLHDWRGTKKASIADFLVAVQGAAAEKPSWQLFKDWLRKAQAAETQARLRRSFVGSGLHPQLSLFEEVFKSRDNVHKGSTRQGKRSHEDSQPVDGCLPGAAAKRPRPNARTGSGGTRQRPSKERLEAERTPPQASPGTGGQWPPAVQQLRTLAGQKAAEEVLLLIQQGKAQMAGPNAPVLLRLEHNHATSYALAYCPRGRSFTEKVANKNGGCSAHVVPVLEEERASPESATPGDNSKDGKNTPYTPRRWAEKVMGLPKANHWKRLILVALQGGEQPSGDSSSDEADAVVDWVSYGAWVEGQLSQQLKQK